ncbi:hypothetical protein [Rhizobium sp. AN80A]|uniref:hypothetical protein n=1 Tax=Rhizobium sp. AN80A TaxID=3040673 RepID=UPI0024B33697|nr:hypothetical protein [Rhizobium sp. AN80A]
MDIVNMAKDAPIVQPDTAPKKRRIGFMEDMINVPDDFDTMMVEEIEDMFYGGDLFPAEDPIKPILTDKE